MRGRKKLEVPSQTVQIKLTLREGIDDDLIEFFASLPKMKRSQSVKSALRSGSIGVQSFDADDDISSLMEDLFF